MSVKGNGTAISIHPLFYEAYVRFSKEKSHKGLRLTGRAPYSRIPPDRGDDCLKPACKFGFYKTFSLDVELTNDAPLRMFAYVSHNITT